MRKLLEGLIRDWEKYSWDVDDIYRNVVYLGDRGGAYVKFSFDENMSVIERRLPTPDDQYGLFDYAPVRIPVDLLETFLIKKLIDSTLKEKIVAVRQQYNEKRYVTLLFMLQHFREIVLE